MSLISWTPESGFITQRVQGQSFKKLGSPTTGSQYKLLPEEALYLAESDLAYVYESANAIKAHENGETPMSIFKLYRLMGASGCTVARYSHFLKLLRLGFVVRPLHDGAESSSAAQQRVSRHNLDGNRTCCCAECPLIEADYNVWKIEGNFSRSLLKQPPSHRMLVIDERFDYTVPPLDRLASLDENSPLIIGRGDPDHGGAFFTISEIKNAS